MKRKKSSSGAVIITKDFMSMPEIVNMYLKDGGKDMNVLLYLCCTLAKCTNAIGLTKDLHGIASFLKKYESSLEKIMIDTEFFVIDHKHGIFYSPRQRVFFGLDAHPTEEEINNVLTNGNIFYQRRKRTCKADAKTAEETTKKEGRNTEESAKKNLLDSESADNQSKCDSLSNGKSNDNITNDNGNITTKENAYSSNAACSDDAADVNEFKRILSSDDWAESVCTRTGVNLRDATVLDSFAHWMHSYCKSQEKTLNGEIDIRRYAANLLRTNTKTRAEYDSYVASGTSEKLQDAETNDIKIEPEDADYECVTDGIRYSCNGQLLPPDAPKQPSPDAVYSYTADKWINASEYDKTVEREVYRRRRTAEQWYITDKNTTENTQEGGML